MFLDLNLTNKFSYRIGLVLVFDRTNCTERDFWTRILVFRFFVSLFPAQWLPHRHMRQKRGKCWSREKAGKSQQSVSSALTYLTSKDGRHAYDNRVFRRKASGLVKGRFKYFGVRKNLSVRFTRCSLEDQKWSGFPEHLAGQSRKVCCATKLLQRNNRCNAAATGKRARECVHTRLYRRHWQGRQSAWQQCSHFLSTRKFQWKIWTFGFGVQFTCHVTRSKQIFSSEWNCRYGIKTCPSSLGS